MSKYIKNDSGGTDTWAGQELSDQQVYELNFQEHERWADHARTAGSKVETDINSGALKISNDNFATTMTAADGLAFMKSMNADCIKDVIVDDAAKADGFALKYDSASDKIIYGSVPGPDAVFACISAKRSTVYSITTTPTDLAFDVQDVETDAAVLEHHDTNTERIYVHESSHVYGAVNFEFNNTVNASRHVTIDLYMNGTTPLASMDFEMSKSAVETVTRTLIVPPLSPGAYLTVRMSADATGVDIEPGTRLTVFQMKGKTGPQGATGAAGADGADGALVHLGAWVTSTSYSVGDGVENDGASYTCHTAHTSSAGDEPGVGGSWTSYWYLMASAGVDGAAGSANPVQNYLADMFENPNNSDWAVNALAPVAVDSNNAALVVRRFDDTAAEGVGMTLNIPSGATNIIFKILSRAQTAPGGAQTVKLDLYEREISDNAAITAWSGANALTDISIPANTNFQTDSDTKTLSSLGLTAGKTHQLEIVRDSVDAGDTLSGDWCLLLIQVEFS